MASDLPVNGDVKTNGVAEGVNGHGGAPENNFAVKAGLARMLKGGVIMDVVNAEQVCDTLFVTRPRPLTVFTGTHSRGSGRISSNGPRASASRYQSQWRRRSHVRSVTHQGDYGGSDNTCNGESQDRSLC